MDLLICFFQWCPNKFGKIKVQFLKLNLKIGWIDVVITFSLWIDIILALFLFLSSWKVLYLLFFQKKINK